MKKAEVLRDGVQVSVTKITEWELALDMARSTINKSALRKEPSLEFKQKILIAEHSPIRTQQYLIEIKGAKCWASQHLARHDAFSDHTVRESHGDVHFVGTSRTDRTGIDRDEMKQAAPVNHNIYCNAQDLITISKLRLCRLASKETRHIWEAVKECVEQIDPAVANVMMPSCIYRGFCPEVGNCCGYVNTEAYKKRLEEYRSLPNKNL